MIKLLVIPKVTAKSLVLSKEFCEEVSKDRVVLMHTFDSEIIKNSEDCFRDLGFKSCLDILNNQINIEYLDEIIEKATILKAPVNFNMNDVLDMTTSSKLREYCVFNATMYPGSGAVLLECYNIVDRCTACDLDTSKSMYETYKQIKERIGDNND